MGNVGGVGVGVNVGVAGAGAGAGARAGRAVMDGKRAATIAKRVRRRMEEASTMAAIQAGDVTETGRALLKAAPATFLELLSKKTLRRVQRRGVGRRGRKAVVQDDEEEDDDGDGGRRWEARLAIC